MTTVDFLAACLGLLLAPGPSNTLIALAGAAGGMRRLPGLIPAEVLGYLTTILPLALIGGAGLAQHPRLAAGLTAAAALWVLVMALRLWRAPGAEGISGGVTFGRLYLTTVLNPKALIFALVLLPAPQEPLFAARLGLFLCALLAAALIWGMGGALLAGRKDAPTDTRRVTLLRRLAASWLAVVAFGLIGSLVTT